MTQRWQWFLAACLFGVLMFFATDKLTESPPTWFDEGIYLQAAMNDAIHGEQQLQIAPTTYASTAFVTGGFPFLKPISWSFKLFGIGLLQARIVMVGFIISCVAIFFLLAYRLFGIREALASLALLVTFPPLYGQGKNVLGEVPGLLFLGVFLYCINALERQRFEGSWWYVLAGISAGLCVATKPIFLVLGGAVILVALIYRRTIRFRWDAIALAFAVFCIPVGYWLIHQFAPTDSASAVAAYYANPYAIADLNAQIVTNILRFFREMSPMYFAALMCIWTVSVVIRVRAKEKISIAETTAFVFAVLVIVGYLRTAGWYRYFFVAEIPALVFAPNALMVIMRSITRKHVYVASSVVGLLVVLHVYQLFTGSWVAAHGARTTAHDMQIYMDSLPNDAAYFVYNTPAVVIFLPTLNYYQYLIPNPHMDLGRDELVHLQAGTPDYVVTSNTSWASASSTMMHYEVIKNIDDFVVASRR